MLGNLLVMFLHIITKKYMLWLSWVEWSYNTNFHSAIKITPFEAVYGYVPPIVPVYESGTTKVDSVEQSLTERDNILSLLKNN